MNQIKKRILTGDTPSGRLHIGHYVGTLENRVRLQHEYETYILLANVHAYANDFRQFEKINRDVYDVYLDNLSVGIDPEVSTIYLESEIPETMELYSYFLTMVTHARAMRNPSVKEEILYKSLDPTMGFISYPILQAADILGFKANLVPVGEDQSPVIEQTREIANDFNKVFGKTFPIPEAMIGRVARLVGTDGKKKMSKSGGNSILLSDDEATLKQKIKSCYTDPSRIHATDPGKVEGNPIFEYHQAFNPDKEEVKDLENKYRLGQVGDSEVKEKLFIALNKFLIPIREKRKFYEDRPDVAKEILRSGTLRARQVVATTLAEVKEKMGLMNLLKK
jgi:tryptophanyl-tRNA synthetase